MPARCSRWQKAAQWVRASNVWCAVWAAGVACLAAEAQRTAESCAACSVACVAKASAPLGRRPKLRAMLGPSRTQTKGLLAARAGRRPPGWSRALTVTLSGYALGCRTPALGRGARQTAAKAARRRRASSGTVMFALRAAKAPIRLSCDSSRPSTCARARQPAAGDTRAPQVAAESARVRHDGGGGSQRRAHRPLRQTTRARGGECGPLHGGAERAPAVPRASARGPSATPARRKRLGRRALTRSVASGARTPAPCAAPQLQNLRPALRCAKEAERGS